MKRRHVLGFLCVVAIVAGLTARLLPAASTAQPGNVIDEVTKLLNAQVASPVIEHYIEKHGPPETLTADQIVTLKKAGATEAILLALMSAKGSSYPFDLDDGHTVGKPITHGMMAVYPIYRKGPATVAQYLTLDEATDRKIITITEKGSGSVPVVILVNNGDLPIYISAGEVVLGGKQDRIVAYDVLVQPKKKMTIEVRCVEQGRWAGSKKAFVSAKAMGNKGSRLAAQFKSQRDVWAAVSENNSRASVQPSTGTYKATLTKGEVQKSAKAYAVAVLPKLTGRHLVGMIVAINGKVHSIDIFGNPGLFQKMKEKLLKSYVLDTIGVKDAKATPPTPEHILSFYNKTMELEAKKGKQYDANRNTRRVGKEASANESLDVDGHLLHRNFLAH